ncbi:MAG: hypothetical protein ACRCX2_33215 [Paraclostridium sp.]
MNRLKFIGFNMVDGETKAIYIDKVTKQYQTLITNIRKIKNKETGEFEEIYNGMSWRILVPEEIGVI